MGIPTKPSQNLTAQGAIVIKNIGRAQGHPHVLGYLQQTSATLPIAATENHTYLGQFEESSMRGCQPALALGWAAIAEEPAALIGHGGVCEGGKPGEAPGFPLLGKDTDNT